MRTAPPKNKRPRKDDSEPAPPVYAPPRLHPLRFVGGVVQGLMGAALLAGLLLGVGVWRGGDRFIEGLRLMVMPPPPEPEVDVRTVVVQQIRGANELTTAIFAMEAVVPTKSDRTLAGYTIGSTSLLYIAYGEVRAGVDLNKITPDDVQVEESGIRITLPPPKIL